MQISCIWVGLEIPILSLPGVVQERGGEPLDLLPQYGVLLAELGLHLGQTLEGVGQLESGEDGVLAGQRNQGGAGEGLVSVQSGHGEPQAVSLTGQGALVTDALKIENRG